MDSQNAKDNDPLALVHINHMISRGNIAHSYKILFFYINMAIGKIVQNSIISKHEV